MLICLLIVWLISSLPISFIYGSMNSTFLIDFLSYFLESGI